MSNNSGSRQSSNSLAGSSALPSKHEGLLSKWTNVVRGWQHRWFVLDPVMCTLDYYLTEEDRGSSPRASIKLPGASVVASQEDAQAFILNSANGESYKFKAFDTKERQKWVNLLRCVISPGYGLRDPSSYSRSNTVTDSRKNSLPRSSNSKLIHFTSEPPSMKFDEPFAPARMIISKVRDKRADVCRLIEDGNSELSPVSSDLLLLKATSLATWDCLHHCLFALMNTEPENGDTLPLDPYTITDPELRPTGQSQSFSGLLFREAETSPSRLKSPSIITDTPEQLDERPLLQSPPSVPPDMMAIKGLRLIEVQSNESVSVKKSEELEIPIPKLKASPVPIKRQDSRPPVFAEDDEEITDVDEEDSEELGSVESEKSVILHLIGQLKIGMDLTKVTLPTFILERRSLLEMFADYMGHASVILRVPDMESEEQRMIGVLEWYLTSFHIVRKGTQAKKPYNPIIGETFHCSWHVPNEFINRGNADGPTAGKQLRLKYVGEQVSHHPPVTAFYVECPEKNICMGASIYTQSKFYGLSIGVNMVGSASLYLTEFGEEYTFTLPSAYARSILTVPWCELGGKVALDCKKSGYSAEIVFHTKPFYGGKLHRVTAEVMNPQGKVVCKVNGEWNSNFEFSSTNTGSKTIDVSTLPIVRKRVRPIDKQDFFESRRLWRKVTEALAVEDIDKATAEKNHLEEIQRKGERTRKAADTRFPNKFFHLENGAWVFNNPLFRKGAHTS